MRSIGRNISIILDSVYTELCGVTVTTRRRWLRSLRAGAKLPPWVSSARARFEGRFGIFMPNRVRLFHRRDVTLRSHEREQNAWTPIVHVMRLPLVGDLVGS
ncbi:hypothetical protein HN011_004077 [Eciton burchellii]|nr:hypothetical protein HN011_004077 [Eciton burchellii]